ncbi:MAG: aldehyde dehydrogenase family protein, partial [Opitutaceae bacterium]
LAIMPWNFPYWQVVRAAAPALCAGNVIVLKHAPNVPGCALVIEEVFREADLPGGSFQTLLLANERIPAVIADERIQAVTLTGSPRAGRIVAALAGQAMKKGVFELGGSDAYLVLDDADLDRAAEICAESRLINSGQSCICAKRFIVAAGVRREFERKFVERIAARSVGDPREEATQVGPLAREDLRRRLETQVAVTLKRGARLLHGGGPVRGPGYFYAPTVLTSVPAASPAYSEELVGPVAAIIPARTEAAAVEIANDSPYGLGAAVFSRDVARARRIAERLQAGAVFVNDFVRSDPSLPFGGVKSSGYGRELGIFGLREFVNIKTVCVRE